MSIGNRYFPFGIKRPLLLAFLFFFSSSSWAQDASLEKVRLAYPARSLSVLHIQVAREKGIYKKYGLAVEAIQMRPTITVATLLSREIQYVASLGSTVRVALKGAPVKIVTVSLTAPFFIFLSRPHIH